MKTIPQISAADLARRLAQEDVCLLDVREDWELETACVEAATHIPMNDVPDQLDKLLAVKDDKDLVVMCHSGRRSMVIAQYLNQAGVSGVFNLEGGIDAWSRDVDPAVPQY